MGEEIQLNVYNHTVYLVSFFVPVVDCWLLFVCWSWFLCARLCRQSFRCWWFVVHLFPSCACSCRWSLIVVSSLIVVPLWSEVVYNSTMHGAFLGGFESPNCFWDPAAAGVARGRIVVSLGRHPPVALSSNKYMFSLMHAPEVILVREWDQPHSEKKKEVSIMCLHRLGVRSASSPIAQLVCLVAEREAHHCVLE